jgi:CHASE2 domain-containing sensor protein
MDLLVELPGKDEIPHYSYQEILAHPADYAPNFKDKLVVIGYQKDDKLPSSSSEKEPRYGAEIHATAMSTLLTGNYIRPLPVPFHYLFILLLVAIAAFLQIKFSAWMERTQTIPLPFLPAPINKITIPTPIFVVSLIYLLFAVLAFKLSHVVFDMSYHLAALILTYFLFVVGRSKFVR